MSKIENKISVALCTYNGEKYIEKQLHSILNQSMPVDEIVVCDDCSNDKTVEILNSFKDKYPSILRFFCNEKNLRSSKNFEKAISLCTGNFIFLSDQDDIWKSEKVAKTIAVFNANPSAEAVFSDADFIDENDIKIHSDMSLWESVSFFEPEKNSNLNLYDSLINMGNFLTGATLCLKKEVLPFCFPFQTIDVFIHDEWLAYILTKRGALFLTNEKLISYRLHSNQQIGVGKVKDARKKVLKNKYHYKLIMNLFQAKKFRDFKAKSRAYFYQYEKYFRFYEKFNNYEYYEISESLLKKHLEAQIGMKKSNFLKYCYYKYFNKKMFLIGIIFSFSCF